MYTVLIVEDEMLVSVGLQNMIRWADMNMAIVGDARNGKQGLELYYQKKPDIILTDIRMPVMDGLEMIARIRKEDKDTRIVVLSSYEDFELVRQAFVLGISDYILKLKMMPEEMENVMRKVWHELLDKEVPQKAESDGARQDKEQELMKTAEAYIRNGSCGCEAFRVCAGQLKIREEHLCVCMMEVNCAETEAGKNSDHDKKVTGAIRNLLQNLLAEHDRGKVWNVAPRRYMILMSAEETGAQRPEGGLAGEESSRLIQREICGRIQQAVRSGMNRECFWGISSFGNGFHVLPGLYKEARKALEEAVFLGKQMVYYGSPEGQSCYAEQLCAFQKRLSGQAYKAEGYLPKIFNELEFLQRENMVWGDAMQEVVVRWIHGISFGGGIWQKEGMELALAAVEKVRCAVSLQEMLRVFEEYLDQKYICMKNSKTLNRELARAVAYINQHFCEPDLSLSRVAGEVSISKDYLSRLFKKEIGIGFSDYINIQRIQKAQEFLLTTGMRSYEVAREVGFQDESYFSRVFKNITGMRPNEYKRREAEAKSEEYGDR